MGNRSWTQGQRGNGEDRSCQTLWDTKRLGLPISQVLAGKAETASVILAEII